MKLSTTIWQKFACTKRNIRSNLTLCVSAYEFTTGNFYTVFPSQFLFRNMQLTCIHFKSCHRKWDLRCILIEKNIFVEVICSYIALIPLKIDLSESYIQGNLKVITCSLYDCPAATLNCVWYLLKDALHKASRCHRIISISNLGWNCECLIQYHLYVSDVIFLFKTIFLGGGMWYLHPIHNWAFDVPYSSQVDRPPICHWKMERL